MGRMRKTDRTISAREFNRHVEAADYVLNHLLGGNPTPRTKPRGETNWVTIKNSSGANRRQGEILEFTGLALTDLTSRQLMLTGGSPTLANAFGVLNSPVANNEISPDCQVSGGCVGLVNVTDANHGYAVVQSATYVLQSADTGTVRIMWKPSGTGEKTCALLIGVPAPFEVFRGITNASISKGATNGSVSRYKSGTNSDTGIDDTVTNDWANLASGIKVAYVRLGSVYYILNSEKTYQSVTLDQRIKADNSAIEKSSITLYGDFDGAAAWSDDYAATECP
jgi:hypothetical protein